MYFLGYQIESKEGEQHSNKHSSKVGTAIKRLKKQLLFDYDPTVFPRLDNSSNNILIKVGFTYRQVRDITVDRDHCDTFDLNSNL